MALTLELAQSLLTKALEAGETQSLRIAVAIVDMGGRVVLAARQEDVSFINLDVAIAKATAAASFKVATQDVSQMISRDPLLQGILAADQTINILPGGQPIKVDGVVVGGLGVAGGFYVQDNAVAEFAVA